MAYEKLNLTDGTVLKADHLRHIEDGIVNSGGIGTVFDASATGENAHAEGHGTKASGRFSHAEGCSTKASGFASHAEGWATTASIDTSHAEGCSTKASGFASHAEGSYTVASSDSAHAEGSQSQALGAYCHSEGLGTIANGRMQHVQGSYNIIDELDDQNRSKYIHIVGNGDDGNSRSNAHTLDWSGNAWYAGYVEGTALILPSPNGTRWRITIDDTGTLTAAAIT